ncbi:PAS domain S-box protein [Thermanaerosceptrum fracticalcis]|uniref:PAS domain S-box protein n=1 Tax=Thermanaerosceptrum fracticalcis TaxID=1712410 RepID=A0A7G6DYK7_THEFR|nr:sigma 54-interacting transcriptional regulator [Thermanaerosceptrum fracticalcis]QNB44911.1 PAS domain S-box protein [Thermanaerosceptrum fracticalcis]
MDHINVVIIGAGQGGTSILNVLLMLDKVHVLGIADINSQAPGMKLARAKGIFTTEDLTQLLNFEDVDVIIEATNAPEIRSKIRHLKDNHSALMEAQAAHLMMNLVSEQEKLLKVKELQEQLAAILNAAQEGVQVADANGQILYINKSFTDITGVTSEERIGKNVFDVSPEGALAEVLCTKAPVFGKLNKIEDTNIEVLSNASPILVDDQMVGAVVVFRDISDIKRMAERLEESKEVIKTLKEGIHQLASAKYTFNDLIGKDPQFLQSIKMARQAARNAATVLITGESGTGKELFAHAIHNHGPRADGPFIKVNCAAIPENLLESELFGYEKGAFTGALKTKMGKFELAHGGTIFLDEIGDMNIALQAKLLRVLQEKEVERLGSNHTRKIDVRIIAATNHDLQKHVEKEMFRQDLYYRLNVLHIHIPPLRKRKEDIPLLVQYIMQNLNKSLGRNCVLDPDALAMLSQYNWPGNIRELENLLERVIILSESQVISPELVQTHLKPSKIAEGDEIIPLEELEKQMIYRALAKYGRSLAGKKEAAAKLKISLATLYNKLEKYEKL